MEELKYNFPLSHAVHVIETGGKVSAIYTNNILDHENKSFDNSDDYFIKTIYREGDELRYHINGNSEDWYVFETPYSAFTIVHNLINNHEFQKMNELIYMTDRMVGKPTNQIIDLTTMKCWALEKHLKDG